MIIKELKIKIWKEKIEDKYACIKAESMSILSDMGIEPRDIKSWKDIPQVIKKFSAKNSTPIAFIGNLDQATYKARETLKWNISMINTIALEKIKEKHKRKT